MQIISVLCADFHFWMVDVERRVRGREGKEKEKLQVRMGRGLFRVWLMRKKRSLFYGI